MRRPQIRRRPRTWSFQCKSELRSVFPQMGILDGHYYVRHDTAGRRIVAIWWCGYDGEGSKFARVLSREEWEALDQVHAASPYHRRWGLRLAPYDPGAAQWVAEDPDGVLSPAGGDAPPRASSETVVVEATVLYPIVVSTDLDGVLSPAGEEAHRRASPEIVVVEATVLYPIVVSTDLSPAGEEAHRRASPEPATDRLP